MSSQRPLVLALLAFGACGQAVTDEDVGLLESALIICPKGAMTPGIDVSHWNGTIDWVKVKGDGVQFAFMKATEHATFVDNKFATNWSNSAKAGVVRGAYHFFRPGVDPIAQADHFFKITGVPLPGDLPPVCDLESTDNLTGVEVHDRLLLFLQRVEQLTGRVPIIYTSVRFLGVIGNQTAGLEHYHLWVVDWRTSHTCPDVPSPPWKDWVFWQYSNLGMIDGFAAGVDVDLNHFNGTLDDLRKFTGTQAAADGGSGDGGSGDAGRDGGDDLLAAPDLTGATGAPQPRGCGCDVGGRATPPPLALLLLLAPLLALRARRHQVSTSKTSNRSRART